MVTHHPMVYNQLALVWGGKSYLTEHPAEAAEEVMEKLKAAGNVVVGDIIVVASGNQPGVAGGTDTVSIMMVS
jgi:pyruvate kinase